MPYHAGVLLIDRMFDWLEPSPTRITIRGVYGALNSSTWHKAGPPFTCLSYMLIKKVNSWQVRIAAAFYLLSKMKKWLNVAPILWMAAQFWGQSAANMTCAMSLLCSQRCIIKSLKTTWSSQPFPQIMLCMFRDWLFLLKSESLSLQTALSLYKTFYCHTIRVANTVSFVPFCPTAFIPK